MSQEQQGVKVLSLAHIKVPSAPPVNAPAVEPMGRIAWAGGKITSNKEEAMLAFLRRKEKQGGLSREQKEILHKLVLEGHGGHRATVMTGQGEVARAHEVYGGEKAGAGGQHKKVVLLKKALTTQQQDEGSDEEREMERRRARAKRFGGGGGGGGRQGGGKAGGGGGRGGQTGFTIVLGGGNGKRKGRESMGQQQGRGGNRRQQQQQPPSHKRPKTDKGAGSVPPLETRLSMSLDQLMKR